MAAGVVIDLGGVALHCDVWVAPVKSLDIATVVEQLAVNSSEQVRLAARARARRSGPPLTVAAAAAMTVTAKVIDHHGCALMGQQQGVGPAQTATGAGDDCYFSVETSHSSPFVSMSEAY